MIEQEDFMKFLFMDLPIVLIVSWLIYSILILFIPKIRFKISNFYIIEVIPNVFVTLGLLGTFMGISYGLSQFSTEPELIKSSIKILLDGLKSALNTSIYGICLSLIFSKIVKYKFSTRTIRDKDSEELKELKLLNKNILELKEEFSKTQHDAIVTALKDVLTGFNGIFMRFINELVEQNFDNLTEAINQLITWQKLYKEDIQLIRNSYSSLVNKHQHFIDNTEDWINIMDEVAGQSSRLQQIVNNFNEAFNENGNLSLMVDRMQEAAGNLEKVTTDFAQLTQKMEDATTTFELTEEKVQEWTKEISSVSETSGQIVAHLSAIQEFRVSDLNDLSGEFNSRLASTFGTFDSLMKKYIESIEKRTIK